MSIVKGNLLCVGDHPGVDRPEVALSVGLLGHQLSELRRHRLQDVSGDGDDSARQKRTLHHVGAHLVRGARQGNGHQRAVEQRLGDVRVEVRHRAGERAYVVCQTVVGVLHAPVQVGHAVVCLVL